MQTVEINKDEKSIWLDYEDHTTQYYLNCKNKIFKKILNLKIDAYSREEIYEYKVDYETFAVNFRLLERVDNNPKKEEMVLDGVVLESKIMSKSKISFMDKELISELKLETVWHSMDLSSHFPIIFLIFYAEGDEDESVEYKRFFRLTEERINIGIKIIEEYLYKNIKDAYIKKNDRNGTLYISKIDIENIDEEDLYKDGGFWDTINNKIKPNLFSFSSKFFCGITKGEFENSDKILFILKKFLEQDSVQKSSNNPEGSINNKYWLLFLGAIFLYAFYLIFTNI